MRSHPVPSDILGLDLILCSDIPQVANHTAERICPGAPRVDMQGRRLWEGRDDHWSLSQDSLPYTLPAMLCTDGGSLGAQRTKDDHDFLLLQERGSNGKRLRSKSVPSVCETVASPQTPCSFDTSLPAVEGSYRLYIWH